MDLLALLSRPEGKTLEFKRDLSSPENILRTVVAFANTAGGTILVGVDGRSGSVRGIADVLREEERLANIVSDGIEPQLLPGIEVIAWRKTHLLAVHVYPGALPPYHVRKLGQERGVFVRVGSANRSADRAMLDELKRHAHREAFDEQPMSGLDSEAIDFRVASELFSEARKLKKSDLTTLRVLVRYQGHLVPSIGGMLLFGRDRLIHLPDAWIQVGRFAGTDKAVIQDSLDLTSPLLNAIEEAIGFIRRNTGKGYSIGEVRRTELSAFPSAAVREAVINAVVHTDYSQQGAPIRISIFDDRLEVENPGILPLGLTLEDILQGVSRLRNRVLGRVFRELGYIEQWGSGIQRMNGACRAAGLAEPVFEEIGLRFRVTIRSKKIQAAQSDTLDDLIVTILKRDGALGTSKIAAVIGRSERATRTRLNGLVDRGLIVAIGKGPRDPHRKYAMATR